MEIRETPTDIKDLDLMKRLSAYGSGNATWHADGTILGSEGRSACANLHAGLAQLMDELVAPLLDRITAREMDTFTMHDRSHGLKVAHLMWFILEPDRRDHLTPPEIAMMVAAAYLHDLGMALDRDEREERLDPESDLWDKLEIQESQKAAILELRARSADQTISETARGRARRKLAQAEEALLSQDTRERHGTPDRYREVLTKLRQLHQADEIRIPDVEACLSFDGDSFRDKLIDICVSHNQEAETLVQRDKVNFERPRFPNDYPVGFSTADLHMVAAALRLADVLDFDRERTPPVLFHYLLPGTLDLMGDRSVLEWNKHLAISNWHIEPEAIVFRGRSNSHIIHHAVVQFCSIIAAEIEATRATFGALRETRWPFVLPSSVKADIHEEGYRYIPYRFELDDDRVYELLMGGAIYEDPLVATRELVQNAVDACMLRDAMTRLYEPYEPSTKNRITIRYEEATEDHPLPRLIVTDTGTGMDALILERYFLKVGRSYYGSSDFNKIRTELRRNNLDFAPVSEFGIGFLSSFLLSDRLIVETAMAEPTHDDSRKRTLQIDGPTRLIRLDERDNEGRGRFKGTRITLFLSRGSRDDENAPPAWTEVTDYLTEVCQGLPYRLNLEHVANEEVNRSQIDPRPLTAEVPPAYESESIRIPVNEEEFGLEGEIAIVDTQTVESRERERVQESRRQLASERLVVLQDEGEDTLSPYLPHYFESHFLRGGFRISGVPGLPSSFETRAAAMISLTWESQATRRFRVTNLARSATVSWQPLAERVERLWLSYLFEHVDELPRYLMYSLGAPNNLRLNRYMRERRSPTNQWLEQYNALEIYRLARRGWATSKIYRTVLEPNIVAKSEEELRAWEEGDAVSFPVPFLNSTTTLAHQLLDLILPKITTLQVDVQGNYFATAPPSNWRETLEGWQDFITKPIDWPKFADYIGDETENLLFVFEAGFLNSRFRERLALFDDYELETLTRALYELIPAMMSQATTLLAPQDVEILRKAQDLVGDAEIGIVPYEDDTNSLHKWPISSFELPEVHSQ